jgi:FPC/CPF motif-containing protein YcgG
MTADQELIIKEFDEFLLDNPYPCVAARAAVKRTQISYMVAEHMACPKDDADILNFLYFFINDFRHSTNSFHSAVVFFKGPEIRFEDDFESVFWQRLQALTTLDHQFHDYDTRVNSDPASPDFSFSLGEEAFFIIGLHPASSRPSRKFKYPAIVFNPHVQFQDLRKTGRYEKMKSIVRKRDEKYSGSINPMLSDYGESSEVYQYSGRQYGPEWQCPLKINHGEIKNHSSQK